MGSVSYGALLDGGAGDDGMGFCYFVTIISQNVFIIIIIIIIIDFKTIFPIISQSDGVAFSCILLAFYLLYLNLSLEQLIKISTGQWFILSGQRRERKNVSCFSLQIRII